MESKIIALKNLNDINWFAKMIIADCKIITNGKNSISMQHTIVESIKSMATKIKESTN